MRCVSPEGATGPLWRNAQRVVTRRTGRNTTQGRLMGARMLACPPAMDARSLDRGAALRRRHAARLRPAARETAAARRRGLRLAPGPRLLADHDARHAHGDRMARDRRLDAAERLHALRPRQQPRSAAKTPT